MKRHKIPPVVWLALIPLLGLVWRALLVGWGLPSGDRFASFHPDEPVMLASILKLNIAKGQFDTGFYNYGTLSLYIMNLAVMMGEVYGWIHSATTRMDWAGLYLAGRWVSLLANIGTCCVVMAMAYRLRGLWTAAVSGLLAIGCLSMLVNSIYLTVDSTATLFVSLSLWMSLLYYREATWKHLLLAALFCGMATATRYNSALTIVPLALAVSYHPASSHHLKLKQFSAAVVLAGCSFLLFCPGPIINPTAFWRDLGFESQHVRAGHGLLFEGNGPGWFRHLVNLSWCVGLLAMLAGVAAIWGAFRRFRTDRADGLWLLAGWCVLLFGFQSLFAVRFSRYLMPLVPALCVLVACEVWQLRDWRKNAHLAAAALVLLGAWIPSLLYSCALRQPDARMQVMQWMDINLPSGATVGFGTTPWFYSPPLMADFGAIEPIRRREACAGISRWRIICAEDEWQPMILDQSQVIVVSDFEYADALRLKKPEAVDFFARLHSDFNLDAVYDYRGVLLQALPHDMLYPVPHLEVWHRIGVETKPDGMNTKD